MMVAVGTVLPVRTFIISIGILALVPAVDSIYQYPNYNPYRYDLGVSQFTPEGRLLQIEYASTAADHSTPMVVRVITPDLLLVCTTTRRGTLSLDEENEEDEAKKTKAGADVAAYEATAAIYQERLVLFPTGKVLQTTTDPHTLPDEQPMVLVGLSGVLADSLSLLETVQEQRFRDQLAFGQPMSTSRVAQIIANKCQSHAFGGGIRPFGATLLVAGISTTSSSSSSSLNHGDLASHRRSIVMYQTDPSGALIEYTLGSLPGECLVIGGGSSGQALRNVLLSNPDHSTSESNRIGATLKFVIQEQQRMDPGTKWTVEAVLLSSQKGMLKLSDDQIQNLVAKAT